MSNPTPKEQANEIPPPEGESTVIKLTDEQKEELKALIIGPIRSANNLMKHLYSDDSFYESATYAWVDEKDAKKLFLYGVCKEVLKVCIGLMSDKEALEGIPVKDPDRIGKLVYGAMTDTQTNRIRKMIELLSILILFDRNTKRDEEYRIFLSAENLDLALSRQQDFSDLFEKRIISNTQHSINDFNKRIQDDLQKIGATEVWFLDNNKLKAQKPSVFKKKKTIYLDALLVASPEERIGLGISYGRGYSRTSQAVHPMFGSHDYGKDDNNPEHVVANFSYQSIISMNIMHLAYKLAGIEDPGGLAKAMGENFEKSEAPQAIASLKKEFEVGDLVLTIWSDLAEVIDTHTSKYGYKAYKIKYLSRPPLLEFPEDWMESQRIMARLLPKGLVRPFFEKNTHIEKMPKEIAEIWPEVMKQSDDVLMESAKHFFADMHKIGVLIPMLLESGFLKQRDMPSFFNKQKPPEPPVATEA